MATNSARRIIFLLIQTLPTFWATQILISRTLFFLIFVGFQISRFPGPRFPNFQKSGLGQAWAGLGLWPSLGLGPGGPLGCAGGAAALRPGALGWATGPPPGPAPGEPALRWAGEPLGWALGWASSSPGPQLSFCLSYFFWACRNDDVCGKDPC